VIDMPLCYLEIGQTLKVRLKHISRGCN